MNTVQWAGWVIIVSALGTKSKGFGGTGARRTCGAAVKDATRQEEKRWQVGVVVFTGEVPVPMEVPGRRIAQGRNPWFYTESYGVSGFAEYGRKRVLGLKFMEECGRLHSCTLGGRRSSVTTAGGDRRNGFTRRRGLRHGAFFPFNCMMRRSYISVA